MDNRRFDSLVKAVATGTSRRSVLKGLLGIGGVAVAGGATFDGDAGAARRPTPTPTPLRCPGKQLPVGGVCTCPGTAPSKCGPDCCTEGVIPDRNPGYSECCDNACCFGTCYGEELCCPTNWRSGELPPTHMLCQGVCIERSDISCCVASDCGSGSWECIDFQCVGSECPGGEALCGETCCADGHCNAETELCCQGALLPCGLGEDSCCAPGNCTSEGQCCYAPAAPCGDTCCLDGQCTTDGYCCDEGTTACGVQCCGAEQTCSGGECVCPSGDVNCGDGTCGECCGQDVSFCLSQGYSASCVACSSNQCVTSERDYWECGGGSGFCLDGICRSCLETGTVCSYTIECCSRFCNPVTGLCDND